MLNKMRIAALPAMFALVFALGAPFAVAGDNYGSQVANKFGRGLANAATGWLEVPKNMINTSKESNVLVGLTWGTIKGALHTVGRTTVGALELATFFVPNEEFVHPTYVWTDFSQETTYGSP